jgi:hypothetical protein
MQPIMAAVVVDLVAVLVPLVDMPDMVIEEL